MTSLLAISDLFALIIRCNVSELTPTAKSLLVFIDETGHEEFADPKYPLFGIDKELVSAIEIDSVAIAET